MGLPLMLPFRYLYMDQKHFVMGNLKLKKAFFLFFFLPKKDNLEQVSTKKKGEGAAPVCKDPKGPTETLLCPDRSSLRT